MRLIGIICVSCFVPSLLFADSAVDVAALPQSEFMKVLAERKAPVSPAQATQILGVLPQSTARNNLEKAFENRTSVSLLEILPHIVIDADGKIFSHSIHKLPPGTNTPPNKAVNLWPGVTGVVSEPLVCSL